MIYQIHASLHTELVNQTLKDSPFFLIYDRDPLLPNDLFLPLVRNKFRKGEAIEIYEHKTHKQVDYDEGEQVLIYTPDSVEGLSKN